MQSTSKGQFEREAKVVLVGESNVGKSSVTVRFVTEDYRENTLSTIGASFLTKTLMLQEPVKLNIWDTAGQEKYRALAALYYRGADCAIVVYDITNRESFVKATNYWINELKRECGPHLKIAVAGNKADLNDERRVSVAEGQLFAETHGAAFFETSARENTNLTEMFTSLASSLPPLEAKGDDDPTYRMVAETANTRALRSSDSCYC